MPGTEQQLITQTIRFDDFTLDLERYCITRTDGSTIPLTPQERLLLRTLIDAGGRVVTMEELGRLAWGWECGYSANAIWHCIHTLRRKLGDDPSHPRYILTVRPVGYRITLHMATESMSEPYTAEILPRRA